MKKHVFYLLLISFSVSSLLSASSNSEGKIIFIIGTPVLNGTKAKIGEIVKENSVIETNGKSTCQIQIGDKTILNIKESTRLKLNINNNHRVLKLDKGAFEAVLNKGEDRSKYLIRTPILNAGVRGTSFYVEARNNHRTYFCVCNGIIALEPSGNKTKEEVIKSFHHISRIFTKTPQGKLKIEPGGLENHTDQSMEDLAQKIGVKIDWTRID